ncbi:hypothetical protein FCM35_KLT15923 [Carex littledalei]|uniref:DUF4283 domain-containing protein n=1 Tax=Carex littledalei TaxID=544730 RepID=A0A833VH65_9POAL|nr:hypothetical protein FCM35_KLT15923 [Carex littledalei]
MAAPLRTPIVTLLQTRDSEQIEKEFAQSFILDDIGGWGPSRIEKTLTQKFKHTRHHRWVATIYTEWQYLIKAPSTAWLNSVTARGSLTLEGVEFPVLAWEPDFDDGLDLTPIWVRISGFPKTHWSWPEVEKVFTPMGAHILEIDPGTGGRYDWRFARIKLGVCDVRLIPPIHYVEYLNPSGKIRVFDLHIDIESAKTESVHAWTARLNGRPYPNGTEFGLPPVEEDEDLLIHELSGDAAAVEINSETGPQIAEEASNMDTGTASSPVRGTPPANCRLNSGIARKRDDDDGSAGSGKRIVGLGGTAGSSSKPGGSGSKPGGSGQPSGSGSKSAPKGTGTKPGKRTLSLPLSPTSLTLAASQPSQPSTPQPQHISESEDEPLSSKFSHILQRSAAKNRATGSRNSHFSMKKKAIWAAPKSGLAARLRSSTPKFNPVEGVITVSDVSDHPDQPLITTPAVTDTATSSRQTQNLGLPLLDLH